MLMPWHIVYAQTHLTPEGWVEATPPLQDFLRHKPLNLEFYRDAKISIRLRFSRMHRYRLWREWVPFVERPIVSHFVTLYSNNHFGYRSDDGISQIGKSFEVELYPTEVESLERISYRDVPLNLYMHLSRNLVH